MKDERPQEEPSEQRKKPAPQLGRAVRDPQFDSDRYADDLYEEQRRRD